MVAVLVLPVNTLGVPVSALAYCDSPRGRKTSQLAWKPDLLRCDYRHVYSWARAHQDTRYNEIQRCSSVCQTPGSGNMMGLGFLLLDNRKDLSNKENCVSGILEGVRTEHWYLNRHRYWFFIDDNKRLISD